MTKAALYARVSTDKQREEATIESQVAELKRQITAAGHTLVKEYIDDGYSGAKLDRPALEELRKDVKGDLFETIYFLNTDRIARDAAYQTIIVGELLKHGKQIIINGKDYVHNPENKFTLTVLGAVAELERAKIAERMTRGKLHRLRMGQMVGNGLSPFGYDFVRKSPLAPSALVINEQQAEAVRSMFEMYASGDGLYAITRSLEKRGVRTRMGKLLWDTGHVRDMLQNHTYAGTRYYNRVRTLDPEPGKKRGKYVYRDRSEWIEVKVPAIVSQELFDSVQERLRQAHGRYRQPFKRYLLSGLVECGDCGRACFSYRRYLTKTLASGKPRVYHKAAYFCTRRHSEGMHDLKRIARCYNSEISTHILENKVFEMIRDTMLDERKLRACVDWAADMDGGNDRKIKRPLAQIAQRSAAIEDERRHMIDLYASDRLAKAEYVKANLALDRELDELKRDKAELLKQDIRPSAMDEALDVSIGRFCGSARARFDGCIDFDTKRQFLLEHVKKVIYLRYKVMIVGSIPIEPQSSHEPQQSKAHSLEFRIEEEIDRNTVSSKPRHKIRDDGPGRRQSKEARLNASAPSAPGTELLSEGQSFENAVTHHEATI